MNALLYRNRLSVVILVSQLSARTGQQASAATAGKRAAIEPGASSLFAGIAQRGAALGSPKAPVTLVEYADLQCPYCGEWARMALPVLVEPYVRSGKLRIVFNGLAFVGSERTMIAAGQQATSGISSTGSTRGKALRTAAGSATRWSQPASPPPSRALTEPSCSQCARRAGSRRRSNDWRQPLERRV